MTKIISTTVFCFLLLINSVGQEVRATRSSSETAKPYIVIKPPSQSFDSLGDPLPPGARLRLGSQRLCHSKLVQGIAYSPDGKLIATAGNDGVIRLSELGSMRLRSELKGHEQGAYLLAFSPDSSLLASSGFGNNYCIILWNVTTGREVRRLTGHTQSIHGLAFSPDGKQLISGGQDNVIRIWNPETGRETYSWPGVGKRIGTVRFSPDGKMVAAVCYEAGVQLWEVPTGKPLRLFADRPNHHPRNEEKEGYCDVDWSNNGHRIVLGQMKDGAVIVNATTGEIVREFKTEDDKVYGFYSAHMVRFTRDGKSILTASRYRSWNVWDIETGKARVPICNYGPVMALALSEDNSQFAVASPNSSVQCWDMAKLTRILPVPGPGDSIGDLVFSPDGLDIAVACLDQSVSIFRADSGQLRWQGQQSFRDRNAACHLQYSRNGKMIAVTQYLEPPKLFVASTGEEKSHLIKTTRQDPVCGFLHDGPTGFIAVIRRNQKYTNYLEEMNTGQERSTWTPSGPAFVDSISHGGRFIIAKSDRNLLNRQAFVPGNEPPKGNVYLWDSQQRQEIASVLKIEIDAHARTILSDDGKLLAASSRGDLIVYDLNGGQVISRIKSATGTHCLGFSPDNRLLVSGKDGTINMYEIATALLIHNWRGHMNSVWNLAFAPNGRSFASGGTDTTVLLWDMTYLAGQSKDPLTNQEGWNQAWNRLRDSDAKMAQSTVWQVIQQPGEAVSQLQSFWMDWFREREKHRQQVEALIVQLDAKSFADREQAQISLKDMGTMAVATMRTALSRKPSPELTRRLQDLLQPYGDFTPDGDHILASRLCQIAELCATPPAKALLETWKRSPVQQLSQQAALTLERMNTFQK